MQVAFHCCHAEAHISPGRVPTPLPATLDPLRELLDVDGLKQPRGVPKAGSTKSFAGYSGRHLLP
jgi:hypothetical protein